jgi:hypothetical protein
MPMLQFWCYDFWRSFCGNLQEREILVAVTVPPGNLQSIHEMYLPNSVKLVRSLPETGIIILLQ